MATAPPEPPSPMIVATLGTPISRHASVERAMASAWPALLGADARIGARRIDQRDDGDVEAVGHAHQADRLAIAFGPRHAEIVLEPAVGVGALLVADDADALAVETAEPADDRRVVAVLAIAGKRNEIRDQRGNVIETMRAAADGARPASSAMASVRRRAPRARPPPCPRCGRSPRRWRSRRPLAAARAIPRPWPRARPPAFQSRDSNASWIQQTPTRTYGRQHISRQSRPRRRYKSIAALYGFGNSRHHPSASGCRSRTRLLSRSSSTWV